MDEQQIKAVLDKISNVRVLVYGDFCIDAYWVLDARGGEVSVETGMQTEAVARHYYSLGGASNVVANLAALKPASIHVVGAIGPDIYGREMKYQMNAAGVNTDYLVVQPNDFDTYTYGKRYMGDSELPRIDFGYYNQRSPETDRKIIENIRHLLPQCDVMIFNQQVPDSIGEAFLEQANRVFQDFSDKIIIADSRHFGEMLVNVYRKTNAVEAANLSGVDAQPDEIIPDRVSREHAQMLYKQSRKPVFITRGDSGVIIADNKGIAHVPGLLFTNKLDTVGAGDTVISALAVCLAAGSSPAEAAEIANLAAGVTVQKLFQTGTASIQEILDLKTHAVYMHQPELARDLEEAHYIEDSEIEICVPRESLGLGRVQYVIFDHDGTISTLRENSRDTLKRVMKKCIVGEQEHTIPVALCEKITRRVSNFVNVSTGLHPLLQMEELTEMVKEFNLVSEDQVLEPKEYFRIFTKTLMEPVRKNISRIEKGELEPTDFTIKGVEVLLEGLDDRGVTLILAGSIDVATVEQEAELLEYNHLFKGGIYGAMSDTDAFSKDALVEKIIKEHNLHAPEFAVISDGPVEIRACRKYDGLAIGVASDEQRRHGLNTFKRERLIKAGAQLVVPDFAQWEKILGLLTVP